MRLYIPAIGSKMKLTAPWTFTFYDESRNSTLEDSLREHGYKLKTPKYNRDPWSDAAINLGEVTLPIGTDLTLKRIYIRTGQTGYDSITFIAKSPDGVKGRFWVKLEDANKIKMEIL